MTDRFVIEVDWDDPFTGGQLVDRANGAVIMSDGWAVDAPEDATLDRGYSTLVALLNELHATWRRDCETLLLSGGRDKDIERRLREEP